MAAEMLWLGSYSANFINGEIVVMDSGVGNSSSDYDYYVKRQNKNEIIEANTRKDGLK